MSPPQAVGAADEERVALIDGTGSVIGGAARSIMRRDNLLHVVVAVLVRNTSGGVYVHRRTTSKDVFPGSHDCWIAGCLTYGEEPETAALRELEEELGIEVDAADLVPACFASAPVGGRHMILLLYLCRSWREEPRPLHATALKWLAPPDMDAGEMPPADRPLIALLEALL